MQLKSGKDFKQSNADSDDEFIKGHDSVDKANLPKNVLILPLYS